VDLLGHFGQESGDERYPYQKGNLETQKGNAPPVLLGGLRSSLMMFKRKNHVEISKFRRSAVNNNYILTNNISGISSAL